VVLRPEGGINIERYWEQISDEVFESYEETGQGITD
jgi:hypothetical protein